MAGGRRRHPPAGSTTMSPWRRRTRQRHSHGVTPAEGKRSRLIVAIRLEFRSLHGALKDRSTELLAPPISLVLQRATLKLKRAALSMASAARANSGSTMPQLGTAAMAAPCRTLMRVALLGGKGFLGLSPQERVRRGTAEQLRRLPDQFARSRHKLRELWAVTIGIVGIWHGSLLPLQAGAQAVSQPPTPTDDSLGR